MNNVFHGTLTWLLMICLCSAAYAESDGKNIQDAEFKFRIQMTSALNNDPKAQFLVAEMYEQGMGTPQNMRMAQLWYGKSANQGYKPAVEKLANLEREKQQAETRSGERADQQKRQQAEAEAAAVAAKAARERADQQKRRQAEAEAEAAAAKAERERAAQQKRQQAEAEAAAVAAKAARERADQQKRRQAEVEAAAAKAAKERADQQKRQQAEAEAAAVTAAKAERERSEEQKRRQAEAEATAAAAKAAQTVEVAPVVKEKRAAPDQPRDKAKTSEKSAEKGSAEFRANPCNSATAKFTSTCQ